MARRIGEDARRRQANTVARLSQRIRHGRIKPSQNRVQMPFLDRSHAGDNVGDQLLAGDSRLVGDDPADLAHPDDLGWRLLIAPVAVPEHVESFERDRVRYPDPHRRIGDDRALDGCFDESSEGQHVGHVAADRVEPDHHGRLGVERAERDGLDLLLGNDLDRGDADRHLRVGGEAARRADWECLAPDARQSAVQRVVERVHAALPTLC